MLLLKISGYENLNCLNSNRHYSFTHVLLSIICEKVVTKMAGHFWLVFILNLYTAVGLFGQYKMMQKVLKMGVTLPNGYSSESSQLELSNEYQHDRVKTFFRNYLHPDEFSIIPVG